MDDLISRAAAISEIKQMCKDHKWDNFHGELIHWTGIVAMLEQLPSAQPHAGTWTDHYGMFVCSECGREYIQRHHYCPHCGAKMLRENEG